MMNKLRAEELAINFTLMKRFMINHIFNPNGTTIFNCNVWRLFIFLYGVFVNCSVVYSASGFFVEMEDTLSYIDFSLIIFAMINFFLCSWRFCVFLYNVKIIYDVFNVSRFNFSKSKYCCKNINVLYGYRDRSIKITNYVFVFSSTVMSQWILFPLVLVAFTTSEDQNIRQQNIMNLRYPVSTHTYNQYYFIFYLMEAVVGLFTMYAMIIPDILLISWCWAIIAQQDVLTLAFKSIGREDNSQIAYYEGFKSILVDQLQLNLYNNIIQVENDIKPSTSFYEIQIVCIGLGYLIIRITILINTYISTRKIKSFYSVVRPVILTYVAIISTCFIIVTYVLIVLQSVNTSIYSCDWTKMDIKFKKLLILTMKMNNANTLMIKASPKKIVNLQLFANIITMSYNIVSVMLKTTS